MELQHKQRRASQLLERRTYPGGGYENIITIGMRGERLFHAGEEASLKENIDLLKDIITEQRKLIRECVDNPDVPQMIALYKEVEAYFMEIPEKETD